MRISTCSGGRYAGILDQRLECLRLRCRRLCYSVSSPLYHLPSILSPLSSWVFAGASVLSSRCNPVSCLLCRAPTAGAVGTFKSSPPPSLGTCVLGSHTRARTHTHTQHTRARAHTHTHNTHTQISGSQRAPGIGSPADAQSVPCVAADQTHRRSQCHLPGLCRSLKPEP